ncbi:unnamed protein product [Linum trigynum]|uniref:HMA domain-containing protein n=1 Tax=Linum trigynum TaxID=586398 RepID=A0AAV2FTZ5_9ROSI
MVTFSNSSLMYLEDLSFPRIQVVVVTASMACSQCRQRVSRLLCRMSSGLIEYTVDVRGKQVIFKGETETLGGNEYHRNSDGIKENRRYHLKWFSLVSSFLLFTCCVSTRRKSYGC